MASDEGDEGGEKEVDEKARGLINREFHRAMAQKAREMEFMREQLGSPSIKGWALKLAWVAEGLARTKQRRQELREVRDERNH